MNRTLIAFIIIVVLGLGVLILATNNGGSGNNPDANILDATAPQSVIIPTVKQSTPMPTFTPITATKATITTAKGTIQLILYPQDAPKAATNFATLAKNKFYDGLTFHRVEPGFVIQGGDPSGNGTGGYSIYGKPFEDELNPETPSYKEGYKEGVLAMANSGPNTNGSQFFIMWQDNEQLPHNYTIFGKVTEGMDVVHKIVAGDKMTSITVE
ncbi:MAG TPA: peptidylprolyl isomerase [Candidatus Levybacteria bacterium]|nr:peptidylprolyl isomerase [Candidatus Levybacteria bacterium]